MLWVLLLCAVAGVIWLYRAWRLHERALDRLHDADALPDTRIGVAAPPRGLLGRWLLRAGYARPDAPWLFLAATAATLMVGVIAARLSQVLVASMSANVADLPGGTGDTLVAVLSTLPWQILLLAALAPALIVRARRRRRVREIDRDLPLVLELLATMAQTGLGLDAALSRVTAVQPPERSLTIELRAFQRDLLGGMPRLQALRLLASRVDVTSLSVFVAAVIQAEQLGASIAETLRHQADDLRARRREQALLMAQAMPVKLVLPLVACFLPGIFLSTLGPVLYQMIRVADSVLRPVGR